MHARGAYRWTLWESTNKLIQELLGANLQMKGIAAVLDANVEQRQSQQSDIGIAVVDEVDNGRGCLARGGSLLAINEVRNFEIQCEVWLVVVGTAGRLDVALQL